MTKICQLCSIFCLLVSQAYGAIIINGDFEAGNSGFTSQYTYAPGSNTTEGEYTVRADPQNWNGAFAATPDHTSGSGNMLVVNGATSGYSILTSARSRMISMLTTFHFLSCPNRPVYCRFLLLRPHTLFANEIDANCRRTKP